MISSNIRKIVNSVSSGTTAAFGNMIARNEDSILKKRFEQYELLTFLVCYILFTSAAVLFIPFVAIYTKGITDVNYIRYGLAVCFCTAEFFACVKLVYENVVFAAGKFKQTKKTAYAEAAINIIASIILVQFIGLSGILIGTICAGVFRTLMYNMYASKNIVHRSSWRILPKIIYVVICVAISAYIAWLLPFAKVNTIGAWLVCAFVVTICFTIIGVVFSYLFFKDDTKALVNMVVGILKRK